MGNHWGQIWNMLPFAGGIYNVSVFHPSWVAFPSFFTLNSRSTNTKVENVREIGMMTIWRQAKPRVFSFLQKAGGCLPPGSKQGLMKIMNM